MLTKEDLQAIREVVSEEVTTQTEAVVTRQVNMIIENVVTPQLKMLAEGQKTMMEKLAPKNRIEELEEEVEFLKSVIRMHSKEIAELKKAQ